MNISPFSERLRCLGHQWTLKILVAFLGVSTATMYGVGLTTRSIPIKLWVESSISSSSGQLDISGDFLPTTPTAGDGFATAQDTTLTSGLLSAELLVRAELGKSYLVDVDGVNLASSALNIVVAPGYFAEIEHIARNSHVLPSPMGQFVFRVLPIGDGGDNSTGSVITGSPSAGRQMVGSNNKLDWWVSLGSLKNGLSAGDITLVDAAIWTSWADLYTPGALTYEEPSTEITSYRPGGVLRQIRANESVVDIVTLSSTSYELRFHHPDQRIGSAFPFTFSGDPYLLYRVAQGGTATTLTITREARDLPSLTSTGVSVARTDVMTIARSGTWPTFGWTMSGWTQQGAAGLVQQTIATSASGDNRTEDIAVRVPGGAVALDLTRNYTLKPWGDALVSQVIGSSSTTNLATTYQYHEDTGYPGSYGYIKAMALPSGGWEAYDYYAADDFTSNRAGTVKTRYRPYLNSPASVTLNSSQGEVTAYDYAADPFGFLSRPASIVTTVNGVETTRTSIAYSDVGTVGGHTIVQSTRDDYFRSGSVPANNALRTITKYYKEDIADKFFRNQVHAVQYPDDVKVAYAYQRGNWSGGASFTVSGGGSASRVAVITGTVSTGAAYTAYESYDIDDIYLVTGKSTLSVTIRDIRAHVRRTETYSWTGSNWQSVSYTDYSYDYAGNLTGRTTNGVAIYGAVYSGGRKESETSESGEETSFTYDSAGRIETVTKAAATGVGALSTGFVYDAAGRLLDKIVGVGQSSPIAGTWEYDDAGRLVEETPPGLSPVTYSYNVAARTRTITRPDGSTLVETRFRDGRVESITGTGTVAQYFGYAVESSGQHVLQVNSGTSVSPRLEKSWADWLGRVVKTERPGFTGQLAYVEESNYHLSTGKLFQVSRKNGSGSRVLDDLRYTYDELGNLKQAGVDIGNDGFSTSSSDRIAETNQYVEDYASAQWLRSDAFTYRDGSGTAVPVSVSRTRLTGFAANILAETRVTDAEGNVTTRVVEVDRDNKMLTITTSATGLPTPQVEIHVNGLRTSATGHDGLTVTQTYDGFHRPSVSTNSRGNSTTTTYFGGTALVSQISGVIDDLGNTGPLLRFGYDSLGRVAWQQDPTDAVVSYGYNSRGQLLRQWGSGTYPVEYGYDGTYGDRTAIKTFRGGSGWDGTSWPGSTGAADVSVLTYDAPTGLLTGKGDGLGRAIGYRYNVRGQLDRRTWARQVSSQAVYTDYGYDGATGELLTETHSDSTPDLTYEYNRMGQIDRVNDITGWRDFLYNAGDPWRLDAEAMSAYYGDKVITRLYQDGSETNGRAGRNRGYMVGSTTTLDADLELTYGFCGCGRVDEVTSERAGTSSTARTFDYAFLSNSSLVASMSITGAHPFTLTREYEEGRDVLKKLEGKWSTALRTGYEYTYDARGQRTSAKQTGDVYADYGDATFQRFAYNERGELTQAIGYLGSNVASLTAPLPGRWHQYGYDTMGNRTSARRTSNATLADVYTTDAANQYVTKENNTVPVSGTVAAGTNVAVGGQVAVASRQGRFWSSEALVNNVSAPWQGSISFYAAQPDGGSSGSDLIRNQTRSAQIAAAEEVFTHDADGNLVEDSLWIYQYDAYNRLVRMETTSAARTAGFAWRVMEFQYDYMGRRVQKRVLNGSTAAEISSRRFLYDGWNLVAEFEAPGGSSLGSIKRSYTWGLDLVGTLAASGGVGALVQIHDYTVVTGGRTYLPTYDGNGNVAALLDAADGSLEAAYEYSPYGELLRSEGDYASENPFRFSTKFFDSETGLSYYGHRYYSSRLGRFVNRDPLGEAGGLNLYAFVGNSPVGRWDYLGMRTCSIQDENIAWPGECDATSPGGEDRLEMAPFIVTGGGPDQHHYGPDGMDMPSDYHSGGGGGGGGDTGGGGGGTSEQVDVEMPGVTEPEAPTVVIDLGPVQPPVIQVTQIVPSQVPLPEAPPPPNVATPTQENENTMAPVVVTANRSDPYTKSILSGAKSFLKGVIIGGAKGLVAGVVIGAVAALSPVAGAIMIAAGGAMAIHGAYKWASNGYNVTAQGAGEAIGGIITGGFAARGAAAAVGAVRASLAAESAVSSGTKVFRVWGDEAAAGGRSWTTVDPRTVPNYRNAAGLPNQNSGRFLSEGILDDVSGVRLKSADRLHGNAGGLPELVVPNPQTQIRLQNVQGLNPEF